MQMHEVRSKKKKQGVDLNEDCLAALFHGVLKAVY